MDSNQPKERAVVMDSIKFRAGVEELVRYNKRGFGAKLRASQGLVYGLYNYSCKYICSYRKSPLLKEAQECIGELDSVNPATVQASATRVRELYTQYLLNTPYPDFDVLALYLTFFGLFIIKPGMKKELQKELDKDLNLIWAALDNGFEFGMDINSGYKRDDEAGRFMQELFACAQIISGLKFY